MQRFNDFLICGLAGLIGVDTPQSAEAISRILALPGHIGSGIGSNDLTDATRRFFRFRGLDATADSVNALLGPYVGQRNAAGTLQLQKSSAGYTVADLS